MSNIKKGGARAGVGRPSVGSERYEVFLRPRLIRVTSRHSSRQCLAYMYMKVARVPLYSNPEHAE